MVEITKWCSQKEITTYCGNGTNLTFQAHLPLKYWIDAFIIVVYLINRMPSSTLDMEKLFFKLFNRHPGYRSLRIFGCRCFPYLRNYMKSKFLKRTYPCIFLGDSPIHKGYRCLEPLTNRVYLSRHIFFDESNFPYACNNKHVFQERLEVKTFPDSEAWMQKEKQVCQNSSSEEKERSIMQSFSDSQI